MGMVKENLRQKYINILLNYGYCPNDCCRFTYDELKKLSIDELAQLIDICYGIENIFNIDENDFIE